ncbi:CoA transferase, partial [Streptomyces niveus]
TASWLMRDIEPEPGVEGAADGDGAEAWMAETPSPYGLLSHVLPPVNYEGGPVDWTGPPSLWGTDPAHWL